MIISTLISTVFYTITSMVCYTIIYTILGTITRRGMSKITTRVMNGQMSDRMSTIFRKTFVSVYFWLWIIVGNIIALAIIIPGWSLGASKGWSRYMIRLWTAELPTTIMTLTGLWTIEYIDRRNNNNNNTTDETAYVIVSNHLSVVDTAFTAMLPFDIIYTWKKKWSHVPIFGWICILAGHITIDPSDPVSRREAITKSEKSLTNGSSVLFYPEGTRGSDPRGLLPFKTGAFRVAKAANVNILPITLVGTELVCNGWICDIGSVKIFIDKPITADENINKTVEEVRQIMIHSLRS